MQIDNLHEMSNPVWLENKKNINIIKNIVCWISPERVVKVKKNWNTWAQLFKALLA